MNSENLLIDYVAVWGWHLVAVIFFIGAIILMSLKDYFSIILFAGFLVAEIISYKRKHDLSKDK